LLNQRRLVFGSLRVELDVVFAGLALDARSNVLPKFIDQGLRNVSKPHRLRGRWHRAELLFQIDRFDFVSSSASSGLLRDC
jgi:hypothetical protein